jgi:hypothetical protein
MAGREPSGLPPLQPQQAVFERVRQSGNAVLMDIFARMDGYAQ